jgi:hypothetical protein
MDKVWNSLHDEIPNELIVSKASIVYFIDERRYAH